MSRGLFKLNGKTSLDWEIVKDNKVYGLISKEFESDWHFSQNRPSNRKAALKTIASMNERLLAQREEKRAKLWQDTLVFVKDTIENIMHQKTTPELIERVAKDIVKTIPIFDEDIPYDHET